jgi:hypothetical protein
MKVMLEEIARKREQAALGQQEERMRARERAAAGRQAPAARPHSARRSPS